MLRNQGYIPVRNNFHNDYSNNANGSVPQYFHSWLGIVNSESWSSIPTEYITNPWSIDYDKIILTNHMQMKL